MSHLLTQRGTAAFLLAAFILGVLVGLGAAILVWAIEVSHNAYAGLDGFLGWGKWFILLSIPMGLLIAWGLDRRFGPGVASGGVTETMVAAGLHAGYLPTRLIPHGNTRIEPGDRLTLFGTGAARVDAGHLMEPIGLPTHEWRPAP